MIHRNSQPYACQPPNAHTHPFTLASPLRQLPASLPPVVHAALHNDGSRRRSATDMFDSMLRACRASPVGHFRGAVSRGGQGTLCSLQLASSNVIYFDLFAFPARLSLLFILKRTRQIISYGWGRGCWVTHIIKTYICMYVWHNGQLPHVCAIIIFMNLISNVLPFVWFGLFVSFVRQMDEPRDDSNVLF